MRADGHHLRCLGQSGAGGDAGQQGADGFAGLDQRREQLFGQAQRGEELGGPLPRDGVEEPRGGGVGGFGAADPGEQERDQVRDEQGLQPVQVRFAGQLVDRVELQELQPGGGVEPGRVQFLVDLGDGGAAAVIAVAERLRGEFPGSVHQAVVHRPGVDPDAADRFAALPGDAGRGSEPGQHLGEQGVEVPAQAAVGLHHTVGKAVHGFQRRFALRTGAAG